ncbi:DUF4113 domain-containing protein, partial [bacterium]|nr:DUF4113 domain-containing protein [bacterium]
TDYNHCGLPILDLISEGNLGLMKAVDALNHRLGRDAVRLASTGFERKWKGKSELQSSPSLTDPERLPKAKDGPKPRIRFHE